MRSIVYLFIILFLFSCSNTKKVTLNNHNRKDYLIKEIKTKNSWYIIYAERNDSLFKIVVGKNVNENKTCNKIKIGHYYNLTLQSRSKNVPKIGGIKLKPVNNLDVSCYAYDKETEICIEPKKGIYDLYYTKDLQGLCYVPLRDKELQ